MAVIDYFKGCPLVIVHWHDTTMRTGWDELETYLAPNNTRAVLVRSIGFMIEKNKKNVILAMSVRCDAPKLDTTLVIPRGTIRRIERLR